MPHIERRRFLRRALSGGIIFASLSVVPLCLFEILYVLLVRRPSFSSRLELVAFIIYLLVLLPAVAALVGALEGLLVLGVSQLTSVLAKRRISEPGWMALIYSILALPVIAVIAARTFAGRRAQLIPGKDFFALGIGVIGLLFTYLFFRAVIAVRDRFRIKRWGPRQAAFFTPAMLLAAAACYLADQRVLPGLYGFFHVGLAVVALGFCQLAAGALYCAYRPRSRWMRKAAEPSLAGLVVLAAVAGSAFSLSRIGRSEELRFLYYEHTAVQSKTLQMMSLLRLMRSGFGAAASAAAPAAIEPASPAAGLMAGPRRPDANLVLISIDALRADHMGVYGYERPTTPNLDAWARGAGIFARGYCQVPHTSFSVTSLLTGNYIYSLSSIDPGRRYTTVADLVRRYGYKTAGFFPPAVFYIDRQNFTAFEQSLFGFEYVKFEYLEADRRVDQALAFLKEQQRDKRKFFIWMHFFEPHEPYERHDGINFGVRAVDRYDGEVAFVDRALGRFLQVIRRDFPNTYVALTADHGEEFGEHGSFYHGNALYDPQVRVPLIISGPGIKGSRIHGAAQVIDLPVTLLSLVDVPVAAEMRGTDLGPWLAGEDVSRLPPVFTEIERKKMVVAGGYKLICDTSRDFCELYDLEHDPAERRNILGQRRDVGGRLRRGLETWMASHLPRGREQRRDSDSERLALLDRGRQRDPGAVPGLLKLSRGSLEMRREAMRLLVGMRAATAGQTFRQAVTDPDPAVRLHAVVGAALTGDSSSLRELERVLQRPDLPPTLRRDALLAWARAGDRRATVPLAEVLQSTEDIYDRIEIMEALGKLGDAAAGPSLRLQLKTLRTRLYAIEALGNVRARIAVPDLIEAMLKDRFTSWRKAAAHALGQIGEPAARPALQRVVRDEIEAPVVSAALLALGDLHGVPVPELAMLEAGHAPAWSCQGGDGCRAALAASCSKLVGKDLLLVSEGLARGGVSIYCGEQRLASGLFAAEPAAAVSLVNITGEGRLELRAGPKPPALRFVATRRTPKG